MTIGILTGGRSSRMGFDKALIPVGGVTLLERTTALATSVSDKVVLLGRPTYELPRLVASLRVIEDIHPGIGPMGGLEALLSARPDDACMILACDMPHLSAELLGRLAEKAAQSPKSDAVICATGDSAKERHPCCGVYRSSCLSAIQAAVEKREYGLIRLLSSLRVATVDLRGDEARWVENWNEPDDVTGRREKTRQPLPHGRGSDQRPPLDP